MTAPLLMSEPAELHFTLEITRAATGLKEAVEMVGHIVPQPVDIPTEPTEEKPCL